MFKAFCILAMAIVATCHLGALIPPPDTFTADNAKCLMNNKHDFIVLRVSTSDGKVDSHFAANYKAAKAAGYKSIDAYFVPCIPCDPADQSKVAIEAIKGLDIGKIWIEIGVQGWREFKNFNRMYLEDLMTALTPSGKKLGILSSKYEWDENLGEDYDGASSKGLMYKSLDKDPSFKGYKTFGGWRKPEAKQYQAAATLCSLKVDLAYKA